MAFGIGFLWGLMESLWFFIVPDVAISFLALKGWRSALVSTVAAVLGAMLGAIILFLAFRFWDVGAVEFFRKLWSSLPGYYDMMVQVAHGHLVAGGAKGLTAGPASGIPYRFYVLEALQLKIPILDILAWTPYARLQRIIIAPVMVLILRQLTVFVARKWWPHRQELFQKGLTIIILVYWLGLYVWYWGSFLPQTYAAVP